MSKAPLHTYLRTHRKQSGLSQADVTHLVDIAHTGTVSRHELGVNTPDSLAQAFEYEVLFGIPASRLFAGEYEQARRRVEKNARGLLGSLVQEDTSKKRDRRMTFLERLLERVRME